MYGNDKIMPVIEQGRSPLRLIRVGIFRIVPESGRMYECGIIVSSSLFSCELDAVGKGGLFASGSVTLLLALADSLNRLAQHVKQLHPHITATAL